MSGFKALNIESDDESDIEVDDTKEIQIEEALKLYQTALKYHADGPDSFDLAADAYQQLFESDIFKWPESQTELRRIELYGPTAEYDDFVDGVPASTAVSSGGVEGPSTLPQILHLSHKNYANFKLEALAAKFDTFNVTLKQILADATQALTHFVEALDKDDTDLDLWRRTASVGEMLDSKRVARYCLESVLDGDDEGLSNIMSLPGLDEGFAGEQLRELVLQLQDQLSSLQAPLSTSKRRTLSKMLKQKLHHYHDLLKQEAVVREHEGPRKSPPPERITLKAPSSWAELGEALLRQRTSEQNGTATLLAAPAIRFDMNSATPAEPKIMERPPSPKVILPRIIIPKWQVTFPTSLSEQFPGSDGGKPTVQPQISAADPSMQVAESPVDEDEDVNMDESPKMITLPSRKRSGDAAGLGDNAEEGRSKSKRLRARDSTADAAADRQAIIDANTRWEYEQQLNEFQAADDWMFETVGNLFERVGIIGFDAPRNVRQEMQCSSSDGSTPFGDPVSSAQSLRQTRSDLQAFLDRWNDQLSHLLLSRTENLEIGSVSGSTIPGGGASSGGSSKSVHKAAPMPSDSLGDFLKNINSRWTLTSQAVWKFVERLLRPGLGGDASSYTEYQWPEALKTMVVRLLVNFDETIFEEASAELEKFRYADREDMTSSSLHGLATLAQTVFELHLDIYCLIKEPNSGVDKDTIIAQGDRLLRWSEFARESMQLHAKSSDLVELEDSLSLRFFWTITFQLNASSDVGQDHVIECMDDLRALFVKAGEPTIHLQNNAIMPELSIAALDREVSKLTTKDFFLKVTNQDLSDPAAVIESLEPLLETLDTAKNDSEAADIDEADQSEGTNVAPELVRFLEASPVSIRLMLWQRLRNAYQRIEYAPMVFCCYLRMIGMVLEELKSPNVTSLEPHERLVCILKSLGLVLNLVRLIYETANQNTDALECMDDAYLKFAVNNFGEILQLLQVFNVAEDSLRVGQSQPPTMTNGLPVASFKNIMTMTHESQVRIWILLYSLLKEAIKQNAELYPTPTEDRFDFLRTVHRNLGIRGFCSCENRAFVRMLKDEFFGMQNVDGFDSEQAQVLYDLYGLNCFLNPSYELIEHHCTKDAFLDRGVALQAVDLLLSQASKLPIKELVKHPLKDTIDKVHGALARKKPTEAILRNREIYRAFLKSAVNPLELFGCLKGEGSQLAVTAIPDGDALLASKGWYFLMGHIALTKFRSQKRTAPTPLDDVDIAIALFNQDLEVTMEHWETWFRLAQAYDTKIEETVVWSAEKLNSNMGDIITLQRNAIHCYTMATALAHRSADLQFETSSKMTELYHDFALRLYSSSRAPFDMKPFDVEDLEIFVSRNYGIHKQRPFEPLKEYTVWKLANVLFKRALPGRPDQWQLHYMIGKCMWKMHSASNESRRHDTVPSGEQVLQAFVRALEMLPDKDKKESKDSKKEPLLEPHYKLVSIIHKLYIRGSISLEQAKEAIHHTHYSRREDFPDGRHEWVPYILAVLKKLRAADKSNWYHRMIARYAQIVYDRRELGMEDASEESAALAAKEQLTQQMFTKTMVLQVWRPENERAGRHFVYTARYTLFFAKILEQLKDRKDLEALARRVRRRPHDVFQHGQVWAELCNAYLRLLRSHASLQEGLETSTFSNIAYEEFQARKEPLEMWMQKQENGVSPALDVLREVQELKKVNQSLMKPGAIDDLIGDAYAHLFQTVGKQLQDEERRVKQEEEASRPPPALAPEPHIASPSHAKMGIMSIMNLDGAVDAGPAAQPPPPTAVPMAPSASKEPDPAPVRRKMGVGRREIRSCAESCCQKSKPPGHGHTPVLPSNAPPLKSTVVQSIIDRERQAESGAVSAETSAPGSIHDSADDESELSELEEEGSPERFRTRDATSLVPFCHPHPLFGPFSALTISLKLLSNMPGFSCSTLQSFSLTPPTI
ncbi:Histone transcription regulator 3-like [Pseudocercospora fuligena]|uniref:Histone transcription regulator 3 homolog n=1 Tax=Pseudocercospora fuligena TaxID=685502 RepID=A0A8H6VJD0_9PEZI|nr:Histone transcription regulator 3-like [Pseudocercospora fuligena]